MIWYLEMILLNTSNPSIHVLYVSNVLTAQVCYILNQNEEVKLLARYEPLFNLQVTFPWSSQNHVAAG